MAGIIQDEVEIVSSSTKKYIRWPKEMDKLLLDLLKEEKSKGNKDGKQFNKEAWKTVIQVLNLEFQKIGTTIDKGKAVNRLKTIKEHMVLATELLEKKSDFGWNNVTKKIEAMPRAWESVIQVKPEYKLVRDKEIHFLEDARELFEKDRATGDGADSAKEKICGWQAERDLHMDDIDEIQANNGIHLENLNSFTESVPISPMTQENATSSPSNSRAPSKGIKRKKSISYMVANAIKEMASSMKEIAHTITTTSQHIYTAREITQELKKLGLDKWKVMEALDFLKDNEHLIERFFACDDDIKLDWLRRKMGSMED